MLERILESDWSDYDNRKMKNGDIKFFSCDEKWEVQYLVKKVEDMLGPIGEYKIESAIAYCCNKVKGNKPRSEFIECVLRRLKII